MWVHKQKEGRALFIEELDELRDFAEEYATTLEDISAAYARVYDGEQPMISHSNLQDELGLSGPDTWAAASVLVGFGELHRAKDDQWWWVYASGYLAELCRERELSLKRYIEMRPILKEFQDEVVNWYQIRNMHGNLQPKTMRQIKLEYC
ncbi:hypothetical protein [Halococcus hamelinensis]|uniref:Uncharacterized protein n=1 Tax=Halococcus hamelinensis 100A6 TaxID=1132509 RepID=M0MBD4_9EURY|nr:hypothetical protein [Halococcus hamelinensis]EMA41949.1 hypothetical protein C447_00125 [Halococcus hamelinensis 100A6]